MQKDFQRLELDQARLRLVSVGFVLAFFMTLGLCGAPEIPEWRLAAQFSAGFFAISLVWAWAIRRYPGDFPVRRYMAALVDSVMVSCATYLSGPLGTVFYPFYLQAVVGHGMRFGPGSLLIACISGAAGLGFVFAASEYWQRRPVVAAALWIGIIVLPLYYHYLLRSLRKANATLERELNKTVYAATHDGLTELANRDYFSQQLGEEIHGGRRRGERFALLYIDLDGFKSINDEFGHTAGDRVLAEVASVLVRCARKYDVAARLGGDEFALLMRGMDNKTVLDNLVHRILAGISDVGQRYTNEARLSASVGISLFPEHGADAQTLLDAADAAMYRAKRSGKGQFRLAQTAGTARQQDPHASWPGLPGKALPNYPLSSTVFQRLTSQ